MAQSNIIYPTSSAPSPFKRLRQLAIRGNSATVVEVGMVNSAYTAATLVNATATNLFTSVARITYPTPATSPGYGGVRVTSPGVLRGNSFGMGGFEFTVSFGYSAVTATMRGFVGLYKLLGITDVVLTTIPDIVGIGFDLGDTNFYLIHNSGSGTGTKVDLGANFPVNTTQTDWYQFTLTALPNASTMSYKLERLNTGHVASGVISTNLPTDTMLINPQVWITNNATAAVASVDVGQFQLATPC